jgi:pyruvate kinase
MNNRKTKILATLGPSSDTPAMMAKLIEEGADAFRLNLAHGTYEEHERRVQFLRGKDVQKRVAIIADIRGSKVRVGILPKEGVLFEKGSSVVIDTTKTTYEKGIIPALFPIGEARVKKGNTVFLDDGTIMFEVTKVVPPKIFCEVVREGRLFSRKGVNIPGAMLHPSGVPARDKEDVLLGKKLGVDYISLSFLTSAKDVEHARSLLEGSHTKLIAKIESPQALENFDDILKVVDAVMIARGDLGLEIPIEEVPLKQKEIIEKCHVYGVPVIVATQMLASMMNTLVPTRAEVSDVANAVFDSADTVMLSGESASGLYPVQSVRMMRKIIEVSQARSPHNMFQGLPEHLAVNVAVAEAAAETARDVGAKFIVVGTESGFSARAVAKFRPSVPIIAVTEHEYIARQLSLVWGVRTLCFPEKKGVESSFRSAISELKKEKQISKGDTVVYVSGIKFGKIGGTNMMRVVTV